MRNRLLPQLAILAFLSLYGCGDDGISPPPGGAGDDDDDSMVSGTIPWGAKIECGGFPPLPGESWTYRVIGNGYTFSQMTDSVITLATPTENIQSIRLRRSDSPPNLGIYIGCDDEYGLVMVGQDTWDTNNPENHDFIFDDPPSPIRLCPYGAVIGEICTYRKDAESDSLVVEVLGYEAVSVPYGIIDRAQKTLWPLYEPDGELSDNLPPIYIWVDSLIGVVKELEVDPGPEIGIELIAYQGRDVLDEEFEGYVLSSMTGVYVGSTMVEKMAWPSYCTEFENGTFADTISLCEGDYMPPIFDGADVLRHIDVTSYGTLEEFIYAGFDTCAWKGDEDNCFFVVFSGGGSVQGDSINIGSFSYVDEYNEHGYPLARLCEIRFQFAGKRIGDAMCAGKGRKECMTALQQ